MIISGGDSLPCSRYLPCHATLLCQGGVFCDSPSLRGALVAGQEKEGELATTFLEVE